MIEDETGRLLRRIPDGSVSDSGVGRHSHIRFGQMASRQMPRLFAGRSKRHVDALDVVWIRDSTEIEPEFPPHLARLI
jgi:hypothetical protein